MDFSHSARKPSPLEMCFPSIPTGNCTVEPIWNNPITHQRVQSFPKLGKHICRSGLISTLGIFQVLLSLFKHFSATLITLPTTTVPKKWCRAPPCGSRFVAGKDDSDCLRRDPTHTKLRSYSIPCCPSAATESVTDLFQRPSTTLATRSGTNVRLFSESLRSTK